MGKIKDFLIQMENEGYTLEEIQEILEERKNEIVHHIDGDQTNNKIENLQVMTQSEHIKIHYKDIEKGKENARKIK